MKKKVNIALCEKSLQQKIMTNKAVVEAFKERNDDPVIMEPIYMQYPTTLDQMLEKAKFDIIKNVFHQEDLYKSHDFTLTYKGCWVVCECENDCGNHREYRIDCDIDINDIEDKTNE